MSKKRSYEKLQKSLIAASSILMSLSIGVTAGAINYKSLVCTTIGGEQYKTVNAEGAEPVNLYSDNGMSLEEWKKEASNLVEEVESEGAVLLKNNNNALPLGSGLKVTLFGRSSVDLVLGGTGAGGIDTSIAGDLKTAMESEGLFDINDTLWDFYKTYNGKEGFIRSNGTYSGALPEDIFIAEVDTDEYPEEVKASYKDYSDAAIVVISRVGGEGSDMPIGEFGDGTKYLAFQEQEKQLLNEIQNSGKFDKVIVLLNSSNAMELGWLDQEEYGIDACLWIGGVGQSGVYAVASILAGEVNPSGRLADTYAADSFSSPAMQNFGDYTYTNADEINAQIGKGNSATKYVVYQEGIYVGYRYYETRYADSILNPAETNALSESGAFVSNTWNYDDEVCYSFGYGLSYGAEDGTPFKQEIVSEQEVGDSFEITVKVTNEGTVAGKDVVQVYAQQPYLAGGIEKSAVQLAAFDKTDILEPGAATTLKLIVDKEDIASYDYLTDKTYVLDSGDYYFAIGNGAHDALNNILAANGKTVADGMDYDGDAGLSFKWNLAEKQLLSESVSGEKITNQFERAGLDYYSQDVSYLTRSDWTTFPTSYDSLTATADMIADMDAQGSYEPGDTDTSAIVTNQDNDMTIAKMVGVAYDDEKWDDILNQLSTSEMVKLVAQSALSNIPSIAYPNMFMKDGPQGNSLRTYAEDGTTATGYCGEVVRASTFNRELMLRVGETMGEDWLRTDTEGAYTPAVNIHRTPYAGRNFEYYSEDGFLSGELAAEEVNGMQSKGTICYIKHFLLNDQETNRTGLCVFTNEQAAREIYLKAFEKSFTESKVKGAMGSFTRIGCFWNGVYPEVLKNIVRGEWGSTAILDTDIAINPTYQNMEAGLEAGNTMWATSGTVFYDLLVQKADKDAKIMENMREACHIILFNIADSTGVNGISPTTRVVSVLPYWEKILLAMVAIFAVIDLLSIGCLVHNNVKTKKEQEA